MLLANPDLTTPPQHHPKKPLEKRKVPQTGLQNNNPTPSETPSKTIPKRRSLVKFCPSLSPSSAPKKSETEPSPYNQEPQQKRPHPTPSTTYHHRTRSTCLAPIPRTPEPVFPPKRPHTQVSLHCPDPALRRVICS
ncbi:hypothetical protein P153DRAFT_368504 [Dothidotthia symphoricarpi CBS 119687]|uniref:Uncharacterized protein n=1 Tax=Dothidotthia symphoricarpi CBS 119687 TaxID=1392245 RepID=A0A6A6A7X2_9PLEO|nr:uncharacterized protein P153DRAFT_368504 [Dothidotthia symphoricarpi CBS 119687]KAF2127174.1 hypothetical protein P153DRAFT_368504 [Dothidotthia symphoricarpi CBS 119687]